ncbi:MAG: 16S rRNA (guanine(527)-N(7))-methyltransferase RsmG [Rhodothermia bacterium]
MLFSQAWDPLDELSADQVELLQAFEQLVVLANKRVNLVSRPSISEIRHVHTRHSLALSVRGFPAGATVVDWGTGGGLPGIPLAIRFPQVRFVLVDSIRKKTDFVRAMALKLGLENVDVERSRAETWEGPCNFAVSRATASLARLWSWTYPVLKIRPGNFKESDSLWNPGLVALKGGDLAPEIEELSRIDPGVQITVTPISDFMKGPFVDKFVVEISKTSDVERRTSNV